MENPLKFKLTPWKMNRNQRYHVNQWTKREARFAKINLSVQCIIDFISIYTISAVVMQYLSKWHVAFTVWILQRNKVNQRILHPVRILFSREAHCTPFMTHFPGPPFSPEPANQLDIRQPMKTKIPTINRSALPLCCQLGAKPSWRGNAKRR